MGFMKEEFLYTIIQDEIEHHDLSKLSEQEFTQYRKVFFPVDSETNFGLGEAWEHHKNNNRHHWENWTAIEWGDSPHWQVHCVHMVVDWIAMSYKFGDTAKQYYENNENRIRLPDFAIDFIYKIFDRLGI